MFRAPLSVAGCGAGVPAGTCGGRTSATAFPPSRCEKCRTLAGIRFLQHQCRPFCFLPLHHLERYSWLDQLGRKHDCQSRKTTLLRHRLADTTLVQQRLNVAQLKIAKAQQEEARLAFQQALLNAGSEVNNALTQVQVARGKTELRARQITSLETTVRSTRLLMQHGTSTYLEVLTAQQGLLSAQLTQVADRFDEIQGIINLYQALGGGRE